MDAFIATISSAITIIIGGLIWALQAFVRYRIKVAKHKDEDRKFSDQLIYHRHVKTKLIELRYKFNAAACLASKFHNGQYYIDGKHILKWSSVIDTGAKHFREALQNRLTVDSPVFFGDLKEHDLVFREDIDQLNCDGMKRLLKSLNIKAFMAVLCGNNFVFVFYTDGEQTPSITKEKTQLLKQEFSTFSQYI